MRASEKLFSSVLKHIRSEKQYEIDSDYISFVIKEGFTVLRMSLNQNSFVSQLDNVIALKILSDVQLFSNHMLQLVLPERWITENFKISVNFTVDAVDCGFYYYLHATDYFRD